jgi:hypothetical protein
MNVISYDEQIYLLSYWLRTNLLGFVPTFNAVKHELYLEFGIEDEQVCKEVYDLLNDL